MQESIREHEEATRVKNIQSVELGHHIPILLAFGPVVTLGANPRQARDDDMVLFAPTRRIQVPTLSALLMLVANPGATHGGGL